MKVTILIMKIKITSPHKNTIYSNLSLIYRDIVKSSTGRNGLIKQGFSDDEYPVHEGDNVSYLVDAIIFLLGVGVKQFVSYSNTLIYITVNKISFELTPLNIEGVFFTYLLSVYF